MDTGVAGRNGVLAAKHVMMVSGDDSVIVTTQRLLTVEGLALAVQTTERCAS